VETLLECRKFKVVRKPVQGADGKTHPYEVVIHPGAVVILPLLDGDRCILLRNQRPAVDAELWELPAGTLDKPGEPPESAAARELEEESGHRAGRLERLCGFYPSPGVMSEFIHAYVATDLKQTQQNLEPTEQIEVEVVAIDDALAMTRDGRIQDAKTILTLLHWAVTRNWTGTRRNAP